MNTRNWRVGLFVVMMVASFQCLSALGQVKITIKSVPTDPPGEAMASDPIKGVISGGDTNQYTQYKVVIYARGGDVWWVQPTAASPLTDISADGTWDTDTHGGTDFVALLVKSSYSADAKRDTVPKVGGDVIAVTRWKSQEKPAQ